MKTAFNLKKHKTAQTDPYFGGNCGMFAVAIGKIAQEEGQSASLVFATNAETEAELMNEPDIYHVVVQIGNEMFDGDGSTDVNELKRFCGVYYDDPDPYIYTLSLDEGAITLVRQNTDWNTSWETFYQQLKDDDNNIGDDAIPE